MSAILLIEDEPMVQMTVRLILSRQGYEVLTASSIAEAEQVWRDSSENIALVITDNALPDGSGVELVRSFERLRPGVAIIVASGMPQYDLPRHYYQLTKPFNAQLLLAIVKGALDKPPP